MTNTTVINKPDPVLVRAKELVDKLWNDKDVGAKLRTKAKELYPEITIPEDTIEPMMAPVREKIEAYEAKIAAMEAAENERQKARDAAEQRHNMEQALASARSKYNLTDAGFDMMVERMKETSNFADAEAAAAWAASKNAPPPAAKPAWAPQDMNLFGSKERDEKLALLHRDPEAYRDQEIEAMLRDPEGYVAETFGVAA